MRLIGILLLIVVCGLGTGCASVAPARLPALAALADKTPVIIIPGTTGTELRDRQSGRVVWGSALNFFFPPDRGWQLALPLEEPPDQPPLVPGEPIRQIHVLGIWKTRVYRPLEKLLQTHGYRLGELERPQPADNLFFFGYDWRRDNFDTVRELARQLEHLRRVRGQAVMPVVLVCHSDAAYIGRLFAKHGGASLEQAERQQQRANPAVPVRKLVLVATANGGALDMLRLLNRGRTYVPLVGRRWSPEAFFSFPKFFQHLPVYRPDLFFDEQGKLLDIDLFAAGNWERFGWSIYQSSVQQRLAGHPRFGTPAQRRAHLQTQLDRGRRLAELLRRDAPGFGATRYYLIQNQHVSTPARALLRTENHHWQTLFLSDNSVRCRAGWRRLASAQGDGYATASSQWWLSPQERAAVALPTLDIDGGHLSLVTDPLGLSQVLVALAHQEIAPAQPWLQTGVAPACLAQGQDR